MNPFFTLIARLLSPRLMLWADPTTSRVGPTSQADGSYTQNRSGKTGDQIVSQAHALGMHVVGATMIPRAGSILWTPVMEAYRQQINLTIRQGTVYDQVVDFGQIVSAGGAAPLMTPAYDCGDHVHPSVAGLAAMGTWADNNPVVSLFTPTLILGVPLFDIAFVGVVRVVTGRVHSIAEWLAYTGKDHIHHRFTALGLTRPQSVLLIYFISATFGLSAMLLENASSREAILVLLQAACVLAIVAVLESVGRGRPD